MTIRGIDQLENEDEWSELTKEHVECYFNGCDDDEKCVWNVEIVAKTNKIETKPDVL